MVPTRTRLLIAATALAVSACAGAEARMDDLASGVDARSTCHTSTGDWVGGRSCAMDWSATKTVTTTTTTVVTTTTPAPPLAPTRPGND